MEFKRPDGTKHTREFRAVVVATALAAMQDMGLVRPTADSRQVLPADVANAISDLDLISASKLFIRTPKKFWLDENGNPRNEQKPDGSVGPIPQNIQTDQRAHSVYCLNYPNTDHGVVALNYTWGEKSTI